MAKWTPWDRVVVINLDRRTDRWEEVQAEIAKSKLLSSVKLERFSAITPEQSPSPTWFVSKSDPSNPVPNWCCRQSHIAVLAKAITDGVQHLLKLEDDFNISSDFDERFGKFFAEMPDDWYGYQLSGVHLKDPEKLPGRSHCGRNRGTWCTDMIGLNRAGVLRTYDHLQWHSTISNDRAHQSLYAQDRHFYRPLKFFAQQRESFSDLRGVLANQGRAYMV